MRCGAAPVCANATPAGSIASSSGSAMQLPAPRNTVRRERCFFVMNISYLLSPLALLLRVLRSHRRRGRTVVLGGDTPRTKRIAFDERPHQRRKTIVVLGSLPHDLTDGGHVVVFDCTPERVGQEPLRHGLD